MIVLIKVFCSPGECCITGSAFQRSLATADVLELQSRGNCLPLVFPNCFNLVGLDFVACPDSRREALSGHVEHRTVGHPCSVYLPNRSIPSEPLPGSPVVQVVRAIQQLERLFVPVIGVMEGG